MADVLDGGFAYAPDHHYHAHYAAAAAYDSYAIAPLPHHHGPWSPDAAMLMDPQPAKPYVVSPSSPPSSSAAAGPHKRRRKTHAAGAGPAPATAAAPDADSPPAASKHSPGSSGGGSGLGGSSAFRNVSACNRCRLRKNRCDQRLPACLSCEKAGVKCVGYDPITKREIPRRWGPRSWVFGRLA